MIERSRGGERYNAGKGWCLGHPSHSVEAGSVVCGICGMLVAGAHLGTYQVQQLLGHGRSGSAYLAVHLRLKHPIVLKLFPSDKASMFLWEAARSECLFVAQLRHSSILPVSSCIVQRLDDHSNSATASGTVMVNQDVVLLTICQYVRYPFISFLSHIGRGEGSGVRAMSIIQQIGSALSAAHTRNIVHGALTPGNLLFDDQEHLWIADFGLARLHPPSAPYLAPELSIASRTSVQTGNMTPFWEAVTPSSDQYAFALLCQQLLSHMLQHEEYEQGLSALQRATSQQPTMRFPTIDTFVAELSTLFSRRRTNPLLRGGGTQPGRNIQSFQQEKQVHDERTQQSSSAGSALRAWNANKIFVAPPSSDPIQVLEKRAGKLFTLHDYDAAIQVYQQALVLDATRASLWVALGDAFLASEQYIEALKAYERTISLSPNDPLAWLNSGAALDALGRHNEAVTCYERASQLGG